MQRKILTLSILAALALTGCGSDHTSSHDDDHDHDHHHTAGAQRLLLDDGNGSLHLIEAADGSLAESFDIADVSAIYRSEDGRYAIIRVRGEAHHFRFLDSGVLVEAHGEHVHLEVEPPALLDYRINAADFGTDQSAHAVSRDDRVTLLFDGNASTPTAAALTMPQSNLASSNPETPYVLTGNRHHGIAIPAEGGAVIMSVAEVGGGSTARTGVRVYREGEGEIAAFANSCPGLHGYAVIGNHHLFGCAREDGEGHVLSVRYDASPAHANEAYTQRLISYPVGEQRVSDFAYHRDLNVAVAPWASNAMVRIDPAADSITEQDVLSLPADQCAYTLRDDNGEQLLVLTTDGMLRAYEVAGWGLAAELAVMNPFECSNPRPVLHSVGSFAYLTDPASNSLLEIELEEDEMEIHNSHALDYTPVRMVPFHHPAGLEDYGDH